MSEYPVFLILDALADPALFLRDGKAVHVNAAGKRLFLSPGDELSPLLPETELPSDGTVHWETELCGKRWEATLQKTGQDDLLLLHPVTEVAEGSPLLLSTARGILPPLEQIRAAGGKLFPQLEELEDENIQRSTAAISHAVFRLMRTVGSISAYDRLDRENAPLQTEKCDLSEFFRELTDHAADILLDAGLKLSYTGPGKVLYGSIDQQEVRRAVLHLISNAAKFAGESKTITVKVSEMGKKLRVTVQNDEAMDPDILATAFSRHRVSGSGTDSRQGAGLGLSVVQAVARRHGGSLVLESRNGTTEATLLLDTTLSPAAMNTPRTDFTGGYDPALVELSCVLPPSTFDSRNVDL